ncbi:MAG: hypothetical protein ACP5HM_14265 [Anaerolineae bacterium]
MAEIYEIIIEGYLDTRWAQRFEGMRLTHAEDGTTRLYGPVIDQAALHARLSRIRDLGLELISVQRLASEDEK